MYLFSHLLYLYQYELRHIYFLLWVIIQYYFIYLVAQVLPDLVIGNSFSWFLRPFDILPSLCACVCVYVCVCACVYVRVCVYVCVYVYVVLPFWHYKMLQAHDVFSLPQP